MKSKNITIVERNDGFGFRVYYWDAGKRRSKTFKLKSDAANFARDQSAELALPEEIVVSMDERIFINRVRKLGELSEVLKFLEANYRIAEGNEEFKAAFDAFIAEKNRTNRRPRTIIDYETFRDKLSEYNETPVKEFGDALADKIISANRTESRRKKMAACLSSFYNWCIKRKFCVYNPFYQFTKSDIIKDKEHVPTMTPQQAASLMSYLPDSMKAGFALMLFAGVRPGEVFNDDGKPVVEWEDVDFERKTILVHAESSKTHAARLMQDLPANLWAWLNPHKTEKGKILALSAGRVAKNRRAACKFANIKFAQDICRHSFASYGYHFLGAEHTVEIMGHVGGFDVFAKHYKGLATKAESREFFDIVPENTPSLWTKKAGKDKKSSTNPREPKKQAVAAVD